MHYTAKILLDLILAYFVIPQFHISLVTSTIKIDLESTISINIDYNQYTFIQIGISV